MKMTKPSSKRITLRPRTTQKWRRDVIVIASFTLLISGALTSYFFFGNSTNTRAAVSGDYRSVGSGNWSLLTTWQKYNGSSWVAALTAPTSGDGTITIQSGHTVTISLGVTADQIVVSSGGTLVLNSGITLNLANGTGTDLSVSGTFKNAGTVSIAASATISYASGGLYQHNFTTTAGTIPTATWSAGSTCEIMGYTNNSTGPSGMQAFQNFIWNTPSNTRKINLGGSLTTVNGNLTISATGSNPLYMSSNGLTVNVGGNFTQSGGSFSLCEGGSNPSIMNIAGNYSQSGGTFTVVDGSNLVGTINLSGNFSHTGGTLTVNGNSSTSSNFIFCKSGMQTFTASGNTVSGNVNYTVNSGSILSLANNIVLGNNFTLSSGGGLQMGSTAGITSSGSTGNVQVSGTRSFNTGADYTYNGSAAQVTGSGLPATIRNLTLNNSAGLTLTNTVAVSNTLTFSNGKITTGSNEMNVSNTSTSSISGYSSSKYIIGNLRRSVSASGTYVYPLGTAANYEFLSTTLTSCTGITSILGKFTNTNPVLPAYPLTDVTVNELDVNSLLDYGYWTLTPNSAITSGNYSVQLKETGYSNSLRNGSIYAVITRDNASSSWEQNGDHSDANQSVSGGTVTTAVSNLGAFYDYSVGVAKYAAFASPSLISGTAGAVGAIYKFPNVMDNIDAWVRINSIVGGAVLSDIDNPSTGYTEAFQPFIDYPANSTAYIEWQIMFKVATTSTDTTIKKMSATGVDVDGGTGSGGSIREFIDATMPTSYSLDPATVLTITNLNGNYRALGSTATVSNIDTSAREAMYQLNYNNVKTIMYRTGSINTQSVSEVRQTSLYFRSFNLPVKNIALPIELIYFKAKARSGVVDLTWATASEINNSYFTIERSSDGVNFIPIKQINGAGNSTVKLDYSAVDDQPLDGTSYYRLKQTDYDGQYSYSDIESVKNGSKNNLPSFEIKMIDPNPFQSSFKVGFILDEKAPVSFTLLSMSGKVMAEESIDTREGYNTFEFTDQTGLPSGMYIVVLKCNDKVASKKVMKE
ncbi:MAG: T9SS type A sorting domain-containing protein [Bacteroidia bacterium]